MAIHPHTLPLIGACTLATYRTTLHLQDFVSSSSGGLRVGDNGPHLLELCFNQRQSCKPRIVQRSTLNSLSRGAHLLYREGGACVRTLALHVKQSAS